MARPIVKKPDIDNAAIELFATKGLASTSIKDIATKAGVTDGALYRHYKSKNEMAWILFQQELEVFVEGLKNISFNLQLSLDDRFSKGMEYIYNYYHENPVKFSFVILMQYDFPQENLEDDKNPYVLVVRFVQQVLQELGRPDEGSELLGSIVMGIILQPIAMHRYGHLDDSIFDQVDEVVTACKRVLQV